jgi:hypothetical protein
MPALVVRAFVNVLEIEKRDSVLIAELKEAEEFARPEDPSVSSITKADEVFVKLPPTTAK